ncbi:sirohydrochlorin chelatase [Citricoccus sp. NR2]|uniref:sirohydrochlorin chelatase n=1 Tax=Citricoccus sp. NR2 TaxID=3004095 RepID=UPI0022DE2862|nr:CbiX/SirB N-terminal domain-containing protein [Citricoccus sp. NR2]WBL19364.1 cobalamin biosynthesis protein CbiX [Citricoccus sp. NR2]
MTAQPDGSGRALVAISHGTSDPLGQQVVRSLGDAIAEAAADDGLTCSTMLGHVDVQEPAVEHCLHSLEAKQAAVIVPLLLSAGYHLRVDLQKDVEAARVQGRPVALAEALGPDDRLVSLLVRRLETAGADLDQDVIILGVAGSSDRGAQSDCQEMAERLSRWIGAEVITGFLAHAEPRLPDAVSSARADHPGRRVAVASYLVAPGYFQSRMEACGADIVSAPLLPGPQTAPPQELVDIVLDRFRQAISKIA